jgi:hypothetical protein
MYGDKYFYELFNSRGGINLIKFKAFLGNVDTMPEITGSFSDATTLANADLDLAFHILYRNTMLFTDNDMEFFKNPLVMPLWLELWKTVSFKRPTNSQNGVFTFNLAIHSYCHYIAR